MGRKTRAKSPIRLPQYQLHKATGQARVRIDGRDVYLGRYGTAASQENYNRVIAEWLSQGRVAPPARSTAGPPFTVIDLIAAYWRHVKGYYLDPEGLPTSEQNTIKCALRPVKDLYGSLAAADFSPRCLVAVRDAMVRKGWARRHINKQVSRVRSAFRWAAANELIPAGVPQALGVVAPLKRGRCQARETERVRPVCAAELRAIRRFVSRQVWALARLQWLTGARAGELVRLRLKDIDRTGSVWIARLEHHKSSHHGKRRTLYFGPRAQRVLRRFLASRDDDAYLFSPREAERSRHDRAGTHRRPSQLPNPKRTPRVIQDRYTTASYRRAIHRACGKAGIEQWSPHRLRHSAATRLRRRKGLTAAQLILDHQELVTTLEYAEADEVQALQVMSSVG